ncbi:MAG: hypothetical protein O3A93_02090 [Chloroflexi bacterium]|nr:hypothetical protein [Chloroflexota bacterium]MDA1270037.1 hypothetical protein [Chloroflexota bacterium]PKB58516.1 MAG: hypothetical protein BZY83_06595 [SAR202 cluster bacterium Casp-Chloro-G2]
MAAISWADEFLLLEIEGGLDQLDPFLEHKSLDIFEVAEQEPLSGDGTHWNYRIPAPGVRYYYYE